MPTITEISQLRAFAKEMKDAAKLYEEAARLNAKAAKEMTAAAYRFEKAIVKQVLSKPVTLEEIGLHPSLCAKVRARNPGVSDETLIARIRTAWIRTGRSQ